MYCCNCLQCSEEVPLVPIDFVKRMQLCVDGTASAERVGWRMNAVLATVMRRRVLLVDPQLALFFNRCYCEGQKVLKMNVYLAGDSTT